ncbi:hypothetical protein [Halobacteriovorax sp. BALOs_7]|uniref:hypothetical protein n=1 Tax=Halobacteriovorax sp. BALOs_7 TaxID=2109558 RepID=UPI0013C49615|nr:hypothetical protein [Halobacteriovorax sp. BALOs_7]
MKKTAILIGLTLGFSLISASADEITDNFVKHCQKHCKKQKTPEKIHKCIEKKGRLNKKFRKTKCWEVNEIFEKKDEKSE